MSFFGHQRREEPFEELAFFCPSCHAPLEEIEEGPYKGFFCPQCLRHFFRQPDKRIRKQMEIDRTKRKEHCVRKKDSFFIQDRKDSSRAGKVVVWGLIGLGIATLVLAGIAEFLP